MIDPLSEELDFASPEEAAAYDAWFRAKVQKAMHSNKPGIPHEEVMAKMQAILDKYRDT
jgi:hypothetical protein